MTDKQRAHTNYWKNPQRGRDRSLAHRRRQQDILDALKAGPCLDCGGVFPPECMDFDHVRGTKLFNVGGGPGCGRTQETLMAEIAKCDLVCSNCHRIRTRRRRREKGLREIA